MLLLLAANETIASWSWPSWAMAERAAVLALARLLLAGWLSLWLRKRASSWLMVATSAVPSADEELPTRLETFCHVACHWAGVLGELLGLASWVS